MKAKSSSAKGSSISIADTLEKKFGSINDIEACEYFQDARCPSEEVQQTSLPKDQNFFAHKSR